MSFRDKLGEYVPLLARKPSLPRAESLALRPMRNPAVTWECNKPQDDDAPARTVLRVPVKTGGLTRMLTRLMSMPDSKTIELDEFGGAVWEMCDGHHTVEQLVGHTCQTYQLNRRQAEVSVLAFMRMLIERRLIGFAAADTKGTHHVNTSQRPAGGRKRGQRTPRARRRH